MTSKLPQRLDLWVPELLGVGGIQQYSRQLLRGLKELLPHAQLRVYSKLDVPGNFLRTARFGALVAGQTFRNPPDLAILTHLHFAPLAHALRKLTGLRYWVAAHGIEAWTKLSPMMRRALAAAEKILPVSTFTRDRLFENSGLDPQRWTVLPNTVDGAVFFPTPKPAHLLRRYGLTAERKILFTLARLDRYKGHERVIEALPALRFVMPEIHYVLSGIESENGRIWRRVVRLGLERQVTLTGFLPERDLRDHYNLCDAFVMPSDGEGFGIVFLEALACGRPVLAGNRDGAREPLQDGRLGILADAPNSSRLAHALAGILQLGSLPNSDLLADSLRTRTLERFGFDAFKLRLQRLLES